jgi:hypothetical protein
VALEPVLIAALLLAHLAVPPQLLQTLRLDPVRDPLRRQEIRLPHRAAPGVQAGQREELCVDTVYSRVRIDER